MKSSLKNAIILAVIWAVGLLAINQFVVKKDDKFPVVHYDKVERVGYNAVPAEWKIDISPKLAFEKVSDEPSRKVTSSLGIVLLSLGFIWLILLGAEVVEFKNIFIGWGVLFALLLGYLVCQYSTYSNVLVNNSVTVSEVDFQKMTGVSDKTVKYVSDNENKDIEKLFDKPMIK